MSTNDDSTYVGPDVPRPLGECLQHLLALDARPRTFGDYVAAMASLVKTRGLGVDLTSLCTTDDSPHRATFLGETHQYHCTLDALVVPFVAEAPPEVHVRTVCPVSDDLVTFTVTPSTIDSHPADAVQSFGVATDVQPPSGEGQPPGTDDPSPALAYRRVCPYAKAFTSQTAYEAWDRDVNAHTMTVTTRDALELARALGRSARAERWRDRSSSAD